MGENNNLKHIFECFVRNIKVSISSKDGIKEITFIKGVTKEGFLLGDKYDGNYSISFSIDNANHSAEITVKKGKAVINKFNSKDHKEVFYRTKHGTINLQNSIIGANTLIIEKISKGKIITKTKASQFNIGLSMLIKGQDGKGVNCKASFEDNEFDLHLTYDHMYDDSGYKVIIFTYQDNEELSNQYEIAIKNDKEINDLDYSRAVKGFIE